MDLQNEKCVMVIDEHLPLGIIANAAAIMGITLGKKMPEIVGKNVIDKTGNEHLGIILLAQSVIMEFKKVTFVLDLIYWQIVK